MVEYAASDSNYAYVYQCGSGATALSAPLAKLLIPATVSVRTTVEVDEDGGDSTTSRRLFCRNEDVVVYEFASKVRVETTDAAPE